METCRTERFDCILMDCHMPEMDGYEATRQIRAWERREDLARVPIHALSADSTEEHAQRCRAAGMDQVLSKPATKEALATVIFGVGIGPDKARGESRA